MSTDNVDNDCMKNCRCRKHGQQITTVLTKRGIDENILAAYITKVCKNYPDVQDYSGRTALHMSASVGKYALCEWLINHGALVNAKDFESGSTPLHRALFYGCIDCAVLLIRYGANLEILDNDTCRPFHNICNMKDLSQDVPNCNDLLVWGSNKNYNLGIGDNNFANNPQFLDIFRKENITISNLAISSVHSIFVDRKGNLYAVGSGTKGRLGINSENNLAFPKRINKLHKKIMEEKITQISVARDHSMLLTSKGLVYVCGSNEFKQLGFKPAPENLLTFKEVPSFQQCGIHVIGIIAKDNYSIAYTKNELYIWGKNLGQYGNIESNEDVLLPKQIQIPDFKSIEYVEASNYAMAVATSGKHIFLYYNYKVKVIKPPVLETIKCLSLIAPNPNIDKTKGLSKDTSLPFLKLLLLSDTNIVYIWYEDVQQYLRCSFVEIKLPVIDKIFYKNNKVFLLSRGEVYLGKCNKVPISSMMKESETAWLSSAQSKKEINNEQKIRIELSRIEGIDRVVNIFCDENLESFAVLQEHSRKYYVLPKMCSEEYNFKSLFADVNEFDTIHDIVFHVDNEKFYAHKFIIFSRSKGLKAIIEQYNEKDIYLNYPKLTNKMMELILKFIYCNYFATVDDFVDIAVSLGINSNKQKAYAIKIFAEFAEKFTLNDLVCHLKSYSSSTKFDTIKSRFYRLKRTNFPELYDVVIKCTNSQELKAHKCVIVTRLEYFNLMFTHSWSETTTINLTTVPLEYMEPIIDFLYTSDIEHVRKQNYNETFLYNMIVICDQFFIVRLREVCEILVLERISIRKCGEMLEFAELYNCEILKRGCMDFICQNLGRVLNQKSLNVCEPETLKNLNPYYRNIFQDIFDYRQITPDFESVSDEELLIIVGDFKVDLDYRIEENMIHTSNMKRKKIKEEKFKTDRRNYEKDAISSNLKELNLEIQKINLLKENTSPNIKTSDILKEAAEINDKLISKSNSWVIINDKKDQKKKSFIGKPNLNNVLKDETKPTENFVSLNKTLKSPSGSNIPLSTSVENKFSDSYKKESDASFESNNYKLHFGDFTPTKSNKISQKERKRLSSQSSQKTPEIEIDSASKPIEIPVKSPVNAWGIIKTPPQYNDFEISSPISNSFKSTPDKTKHISMPESPIKFNNSYEKSDSFNFQHCSNGTVPKKISNSSQLNQILENEKQQKEYFEKLKSKSLVLTQLEETAIAELRVFYNVENCEDEIITIARKPMHINLDLPTWKKT